MEEEENKKKRGTKDQNMTGSPVAVTVEEISHIWAKMEHILGQRTRQQKWP